MFRASLVVAVRLALCRGGLQAQAPTPASSESAVGRGSRTLKLQPALSYAAETKLSRRLSALIGVGGRAVRR